MNIAAFVLSCVAIGISVATFVKRTLADKNERRYTAWVSKTAGQILQILHEHNEVMGIVVTPETVAWAARAVGQGYLSWAHVPDILLADDPSTAHPHSELIVGLPLVRTGTK